METGLIGYYKGVQVYSLRNNQYFDLKNEEINPNIIYLLYDTKVLVKNNQIIGTIDDNKTVFLKDIPQDLPRPKKRKDKKVEAYDVPDSKGPVDVEVDYCALSKFVDDYLQEMVDKKYF